MVAFVHPYILSHNLLFPVPKKKEREKKKREKKMGDYWDLESVASPSHCSHGGIRLDPFQGHVGSPSKPHEPGV
jgi:hypothetical protein